MDYEKQHKLNVLIYQQRVNRIYDEAIKIAAQMGITAKLDTEGDFQWSDFPQFTKRVEAMIENLEKQLEANIVSGIHQEWNLANKKNDELATKAVGEKDSLPANLQKVYFGHNEEARDAFITRDQKGMNLSGRVWKLGEQFKKDTELGISAVLQDGLKNGKSAEEMGRKVKQYLNEPNRIFRRRRNKETGELELSKPAQNYHPGQGVYRSSRKNALRLTGTETNIAYHNADYERVKNFDFVLGVKVVVSKNHPVKDICDELAGVYPKGFRFTGWHPHCRCHTETILKTEQQRDEERRKRREALLNGEPIPEKTSEGEITTMPKNWSKWVDENKDKINSAEKRGKLPYFLQDNKWAINSDKDISSTIYRSEIEVRKYLEPFEDKKNYKDLLRDLLKLKGVAIQYLKLAQDLLRPGNYDKYTGKSTYLLGVSSSKKANLVQPKTDIPLNETTEEFIERLKNEHPSLQRQLESLININPSLVKEQIEKYVFAVDKTKETRAENIDRIAELLKIKKEEGTLPVSAEYVNPLYGIANGGNTNCQSCCVAYIARKRGLNVFAPLNKENSMAEKVSFSVESAFVTKEGKVENFKPVLADKKEIEGISDLKKGIIKSVRKDGDYILKWRTAKNMGHVIILSQKNGKTVFKDLQNGKYGDLNELNTYFKNGYKNRNFEILYIEDKNINASIAVDLLEIY